MNQGSIPLLVVSTDSFCDLWEITLAQFEKHFPSFSAPKYIVSESLKCTYPGVRTLNSNDHKKRWGYNLQYAIEQINSKYILLVLDDFILTSSVNVDLYNKAIQLSESVACVTLSTHDFSRKHSAGVDDYQAVARFSKYRLTTAPSIWDTSILLKYLHSDLNPWQFEIFGTLKSYGRNDVFLTLNKSKYDCTNECFPYYIQGRLDSAVVRGLWQSNAISFFPHYELNIRKRGLIEDYSALKQSTIKKITVNMRSVFKYLFGL